MTVLSLVRLCAAGVDTWFIVGQIPFPLLLCCDLTSPLEAPFQMQMDE